MPIITTITSSLQSLFGSLAEQVAAEVPVVKRRRKFSPATLARLLPGQIHLVVTDHPSAVAAHVAALCDDEPPMPDTT